MFFDMFDIDTLYSLKPNNVSARMSGCTVVSQNPYKISRFSPYELVWQGCHDGTVSVHQLVREGRRCTGITGIPGYILAQKARQEIQGIPK